MNEKSLLNLPLFIDSGAHGLYNEYARATRQGFGNKDYSWFRSQEFYDYIDRYAEFIKNNSDVIDFYVNVDVIGNPKLTWKSQRYLEKEHGLSPMPVVHFLTEKKWLKRYLDAGHDYIAIGGLGQEVTKSRYYEWADDIFEYICDPKTRVPTVKIHGFALTSHGLMVRYPWYSIDSTSWIQFGAYGSILVPQWRKDGWDYLTPPHVMKVTPRPIKGGKQLSLVYNQAHKKKEIALQYFEEKGYPLGETKWDQEQGEEVAIEEGLSNSSNLRCSLNAIYFLDLVDNLPEWPWPFNRKSRFNIRLV